MPNWLSLEEALQQALSYIITINKTEQVTLASSLGRIVASPMISSIDVPPCDNSAMDGYAIKISEPAINQRTITQTTAAGDIPQQPVEAATCTRILTGAPIPVGTDAVVIQENVTRDGDTIVINTMPKLGANIRPQANDIASGSLLFDAGHEIAAADISLLSSIGIASVEVYCKPKIAVVATGNELLQPGKPSQQGKIYESHRAGLIAKLTALQCEPTDVGIIPDDAEAIFTIFSQLAQSHDMVISSGGVSVGDADWVKPVLSKLGQLHLWKLAIKPGKPFAFGQFEQCYFCGLPGNPVSAFVTFDQLAAPIIQKLRGNSVRKTLTLNASINHAVKRKGGRLEFARGVYQQNDNGELQVSILSNQSSGVMTSIARANCYVLLGEDVTELTTGQLVKIQPFSLQC